MFKFFFGELGEVVFQVGFFKEGKGFIEFVQVVEFVFLLDDFFYEFFCVYLKGSLQIFFQFFYIGENEVWFYFVFGNVFECVYICEYYYGFYVEVFCECYIGIEFVVDYLEFFNVFKFVFNDFIGWFVWFVYDYWFFVC